MQIYSDLYDTQICSPWFKTFESDFHYFPHRLGREVKLLSLAVEVLQRGKDLGVMTRGERRKTWYWGSRESLGNIALSLKFLSICSHEAPNSQGEQNLRVVEETKAPSTADSLFIHSKSYPPQYMDET